MRSFHVKPAVYHEDGAINYGIAKCIMPIPGSSKEKTGDGTKTRIIIVCALVVVILIAATILGYQKEIKMPLREDLLKSIGKPIADVAAQLEVPQEEMRQIEPGLYCVPAACEYADVTFDILLYFEEHEHLLRAFGYEASYNADTDQAAESIAAIAEMLFVDELTLSDGTVLEPEEKRLKTYFADHGFITADHSLGLSSGAASEYIDYLESTDYYEGKVGKYIKKHAIYYEDLHVDYQAEKQAVTVKLWCAVEADRKIDY